jgi:alkaline phosphatase D
MSNLSRTADRRRFILIGSAALGAGVLPQRAAAQAAPAIVPLDVSRPNALQGVQFGDPSRGAVLAWSRSDRPSRMVVESSLDAQFTQATRIVGPYAMEDSDYTAKQDVGGLPSNREVFVRVSFQSLANARAMSEPVVGRFVTLPFNRDDDGHHRSRRGGDLRFVWGGDTAGQGWGINRAFGGMKIYEAMRQRQPRFFIHSGDTIYADGPIKETATAENGQVWTNVVTPEVSKVASSAAATATT